MSEITTLTHQLKEACKLTNARWAVWLERVQDIWQPGEQFNLARTRQKALQAALQVPETAIWLAGTLGSQRVRSRSTGKLAQGLDCQRLYAFSCSPAHAVLLVGAEALDRQGEGIFHLITLGSIPKAAGMGAVPPAMPQAGQAEPALPEAAELPLWPLEAGAEASYDPQAALESILAYLARQLPCQAAYLASASGETFRVQATWNCPAGVQGIDIPIQTDQPLSQMLSTRQGLLLEDASQEPFFALRSPLETAGLLNAWMGLPIQIGQRMIGAVAFVARQSGIFSPLDLSQTNERVARLAYNVESAIILGEVTHYLQQLALLNDLASTASLGVDTDRNPQDEFARRVMLRLRRAYKTDWAAVLLLSPDGKNLQEYGGGSRLTPAWEVPVESSLMGLAFRTFAGAHRRCAPGAALLPYPPRFPL
jgi:GAF domain-containing protein